MKAPFNNDPFSMIAIAFSELYPDRKYDAFWEPYIRDSKEGEKCVGLADFPEDGIGVPAVFVDTELSITNAIEIFAHELAHVAVGVEHEHDEVWESAFDAILAKYNEIGDKMFPQNGEVTNHVGGHSIDFDEEKDEWVYADSLEVVPIPPKRPCKRCGKHPTEQGHDFCLSNLPGVANACCGHGKGGGYIQFEDGTLIEGDFTVIRNQSE